VLPISARSEKGVRRADRVLLFTTGARTRDPEAPAQAPVALPCRPPSIDTDVLGHHQKVTTSKFSASSSWAAPDFLERNRVQAGAGTVVEKDPKTLSSRRTLPLDEGLVGVLKRASVWCAQERLVLGEAHAGSGYVAINEAGEPYTPDTLTRMWHKLTKAAGVRPIRLHDARHSCGTALHLRGVPMAVIAKWLGHAHAATAARNYAHSQDEALRTASATLGQVVTPGFRTFAPGLRFRSAQVKRCF
jgi:hypothetical protein